MRRRVESAHVVARMYDGHEVLLCCQKYLVSTPGSMMGFVRAWGQIYTYSSSIISNGGKVSNWPSPSSSPWGELSEVGGV